MNLNNMKEKIKNKVEGMSKWKKFKTVLIVAVDVILLIVILNLVMYGRSATYIVQQGSLTAYPEKTVEDAFDNAFGFGEGSWDEYEQYGADIVEYMTTVNGHVIKIVFTVNKDSKQFRVRNLYMDGVDYTNDIGDFLDLIYNNPEYFQDLNNNYDESLY